MRSESAPCCQFKRLKGLLAERQQPLDDSSCVQRPALGSRAEVHFAMQVAQ